MPAGTYQLIAFPARDFLSTTGYAPNTPYSFAVVRNNKVFATSSTATSDATGVVEVNHPGGACWNTVTPNIVPGDVVRIIGWTAKYTFGTPDDLARAAGGTSTSGKVFVGSESRLVWLGRNAAAGNEQTIYENGPGVVGGPAGVTGCVEGAPETPVPGASLSAAPAFPSTAVGATSAAQTVRITNGGGAPLTIDRAYIAGLNPADFTITANEANNTVVPAGGSVTVSVAFKPTAAGTRQANLSFADDAANTTDQTVALVGSTPAATNPTATAPVQALAAVVDPLGVVAPLANSTIPVDIRWSGTGGTFQLQMATGPSTASLGAFANVPLSVATDTSTRVRLAMGNAYQFQVRSCSGAVCSAWAQGPKFALQPVDDTGIAAGLFKGTWSSVSLAGTYGGTVKRSSTSRAERADRADRVGA